MATKILFKRNANYGATPTLTQLDQGEIALNIREGRIFTRITDGSNDAIENLVRRVVHKNSDPNGSVDHLGLGYRENDMWLNTDTDQLFLCVSSTDATSDWRAVNRGPVELEKLFMYNMYGVL